MCSRSVYSFSFCSQTVIVSLPLVVILRDVSTNGRYIGFTLMIWTIPMSTIALIILPKVVSYYKQNNIDTASQGGAGSHQSSVPVSANSAPSVSSSSQAKAVSGATNGNGFESQDSTAGELAGKESSTTEPR